jgi:uncharacterized membrane protein YfcA
MDQLKVACPEARLAKRMLHWLCTPGDRGLDEPSVRKLRLTPGHSILLFFAGMLGGGLNSVAGGGSFVSFPTLLFTGVPAVNANVTNNIAMWMGSIASGRAYRARLDVSKRVLLPLVLASICGGAAGATLLLRTPARAFLHAIPWLMLAATLLFIFGNKVSGLRHLDVGHEASTTAIVVTSILQFFVAVYGGYFGAGMSIVILAMLAAADMADIHAMNALKTVLGISVTGVAAILFIFSRAVYWHPAVVMTLGAVIGGYFGAHYAQRLPQGWVRGFVILVGASLTAYFFIQMYWRP